MKKFPIIISVLAVYGILSCSLLFIGYPDAAPTVNQLRPVSVQDIPGQALTGLAYPQWIDVRVLAAGVAETHTIPTGATYVLFSTTSNFYVAYSGTATVPSADITNGSGPELNPVLRSVSGLASISIISPATCIVTMAFYK